MRSKVKTICLIEGDAKSRADHLQCWVIWKSSALPKPYIVHHIFWLSMWHSSYFPSYLLLYFSVGSQWRSFSFFCLSDTLLEQLKKTTHNPFPGDYFTEYSIIHRLSQAQNQRLSCPASKEYIRKISRVTVRRITSFTSFSASFSCFKGGFQVSLGKNHLPCLDIKSTKCSGLGLLPKAHDSANLSRGTEH